jgi:ribonuclease E
MKELTAKVVALLPVDAATFLLNEKRQAIREIEQRLDVEIIISPNPMMETPQYQVQRINLSESVSELSQKESYKFAEVKQDTAAGAITNDNRKIPERPALTQIIPDRPVPIAKPDKGKGLLNRLFDKLFHSADDQKQQDRTETPKKPQSPRSRSRSRHSGNQANRQQRRGSRRGDNSAPSSQRRSGNRDQTKNENRQSRSTTRTRNTREKKPVSDIADTSIKPDSGVETPEVAVSATPKVAVSTTPEE